MNFLSISVAKKLHQNNYKNCITLLISILSKIGISTSVFVLILSFSALNGFQELIKKNILSALPHGIIILTKKSTLNWQDIAKKIKLVPEIIYSEPYIFMNSILLKNNKIKFFNIKSFNNVKYIKKYFSFQKQLFNFSKLSHIQNNEIILSSDLAKSFSIKEGDVINLIILNKKIDFNINKIKNFTFKVRSIFYSNGIANSNTGLIPFTFFQKKLNIEKEINAIELYMFNPFEVEKIIYKIHKKVNKPILFYTWINNYKYIYHNIKTIKAIIYVTLFFIVTISFFSVISITLRLISKKTKDIAILRSIGASNILIQLIFFFYGMRFIFVGNLIGLIIGIVTVLNFKKIIFFLDKNFQDTWLLKNIYFKNFLLLKLESSDLFIIFIGTLIIGAVTNWYPSYCALKIRPNKILKEY